MKIDSTIQGDVARSTPGAPLGDAESARWLAQLEHAYLASLDRQASSTPSPRDGPHAHAGDPSVRDAPVPLDTGVGPEDGAGPTPGGQALAARTPIGTSPRQTAIPARFATTHDACALALESATVSGAAAPRPDGADARAAARSVTPASERTPVLRYARQRMHLTTSADLSQVTVRDAALPSASAEGVARAIAAQLRDDGRASVRVFVNGRRFDFTSHADPGDPAQHASPRPDQEA